ncbi:MAG: RecX family transcriptional regulator [Candidatus Omnitrophica bacterium]|nr:RecX family transcriptional regulator [Candidatus Omnitrophota bacterium]
MSLLNRVNKKPKTIAEAAFRYASRQVRSVEQVRCYLRQHGVNAAAARKVIADCRVRGLLDDAACAQLWAQNWARQGYGWAAIREKLKAKGLEDSSIACAENQLGGFEGEMERAEEWMRRYKWRNKGNAPLQRLRLANRLRSRGFDTDVVERLLGEL